MAAQVAEELSAADCDVVARPFDLSSIDAIEQWVTETCSEVGAVDIVLHSAGHQRRAAAIDVDLADWEQVIAVNLTGPFFLSREIGKRQIEAGSGGSTFLWVR